MARVDRYTSNFPAVGEFPEQPMEHLLMLRGLKRYPSKMLAWLVRHPDLLLTRNRALDVMAYDVDVYDRVIDTHLKRMRRFLDGAGLPAPKTVYGMGYVLSADAARRIAHWARFGMDPDGAEGGGEPAAGAARADVP